MGVQQFFKIVVHNPNDPLHGKTVGEIGTAAQLSDFRGERLCDDASLAIYSSILAMPSTTHLTDSSGRTTIHINTIFNKVIQRAKAGIIQLWIFDSPEPNPIKHIAHEARSLRRADATRRKTEAPDPALEKQEFKLDKQTVEEVQTLLRLMGITYVVAPPGMEAEQYGAFLTRGPEPGRFCKYMISGDSDVLMFGGNLLRIFSQKSTSGKSKRTVFQRFDLDNVLKTTGLSYQELLEVGVSLGTDFNEANEQGIGIKTIMKKRKDVFITPAMNRAMEYYKSSISDKIGESDIVNSTYDRSGLTEFLVGRGFQPDRLNGRLDEFERCSA